MQAFNNIGGLIVDMDGVLWHGDRPQPGLTEFFQILTALQLPYVLATNNASQTADQYLTKLTNMGVAGCEPQILTSGMATAHYLAQHYPPAQTRIFTIGGSGVQVPLRQHGFALTDSDDTSPGNRADLVVSGLDKALTWDRLCAAALHIQAGAQLIGTNGDVSLPSERGLLPGNGATLAALCAATGAKATVIGKPEPEFYRQAMDILNVAPQTVVAVGDRLDTDILGAVNTGIRSLLLLSGISGTADLAQLDYSPTWIMRDIAELTTALQQL